MGKHVLLSYGVPRPTIALANIQSQFCYIILQKEHFAVPFEDLHSSFWFTGNANTHWIQFRTQRRWNDTEQELLCFVWLPWWWGKGQPVLQLQACRGLIFSMAVCSGKVKREPWVWARIWSRARAISSLALVFTPFSDLEVYQDSATACLNWFTVINEAVATWLWVQGLHCHLTKPSKFHFLNCSSETKLAQPPLVILVILPLNCLHFASHRQWPVAKLSSYHFFTATHQLERGLVS